MPDACDLDSFFAQRALDHAHHFAVEIGPRPSCGIGERRAAQYAVGVMRELGLRDVRLEAFRSATSTYRPFALAFAVALAGHAIAQKSNRRAKQIGAILNALSAFGFAREAELRSNWMRRVLPQGDSQNAIGIIPARQSTRRIIVIYGHIDTHRTPIFYSNERWLQLFSRLVEMGFVSLLASSILPLLRPQSTAGRIALRGAIGASVAMQLFSLAMTLHADCTPYTCGANDNASGAATVLALAERLMREPLQSSEVWIVNNGCEELGCYGISALLDKHGAQLKDALFLNFDMVGSGVPTVVESEGLLRPMRPDARMLKIAREIAAERPDLVGGSGIAPTHGGGAYTDTGLVSSRGFAGLTIDSRLPANHPAASRMGFWHQSEDRFEHLEFDCLRRTHAFGWQMLQNLDTQTEN